VFSPSRLCGENPLHRVQLRQRQNGDSGQPPEDHINQQRAVAQQEFFRRAAFVLLVDQVQVAEDAIEDEGDGDHHQVVFGQVFGGEGVLRVGHDRAGGDDRDHLIQKRRRVLFQNLAVAARAGTQ